MNVTFFRRQRDLGQQVGVTFFRRQRDLGQQVGVTFFRSQQVGVTLVPRITRFVDPSLITHIK